jgi:hypothetical protein
MTDQQTPPPAPAADDPLGHLSLEQLVETFEKLRDFRSALKKDFDEKDRSAKDGLRRIEQSLMVRMNAQGIDSMRVGSMTAYVHNDKYVGCNDWNALHDYILQTGNFDLLQKRVGKRAVEDLLAEKGEIPPGVTMDPFREVRLRKA